MRELSIRRVAAGGYAANAYFVSLPDRYDTVLIDPGDDFALIADTARALGKRLTHILLTHGHFDHILAAAPLKEAFGARVCIHPSDAKYLSDTRLNLMPADARTPFTPIPEPDIYLNEGAFSACGIDFTIIHTPGHTPGGVCLYVKDAQRVFTGDTLFADGFGRTDFEGGSWSELYKSLRGLFALEPGALALPGHGDEATIGHIRRSFYRQ